MFCTEEKSLGGKLYKVFVQLIGWLLWIIMIFYHICKAGFKDLIQGNNDIYQ